MATYLLHLLTEISSLDPRLLAGSVSKVYLLRACVPDIGLRKPLLLPASSVHVAGTPLQINCSAQPTVPPPNISFYIDDIKVQYVQTAQGSRQIRFNR